MEIHAFMQSGGKKNTWPNLMLKYMVTALYKARGKRKDVTVLPILCLFCDTTVFLNVFIALFLLRLEQKKELALMFLRISLNKLVFVF